jgi:NAD(P)-dependent dehydrogenase (short-subunit alcohol dehydrogenase family)
MGRLKNKIALVTASAQGIGKELTKLFLHEGAIVYGTDIQLENLNDLNHPNLKKIKFDVTNKQDLKNIVKSLDDLDILVNCAGFVHQGNIENADEKDFDFSFNLNVKSNFLVTKSLLPFLIKSEGSVINIASVVSSIKGLPNRFVYGSTKAAIIGFTKSIASDFIKNNIRCNAIAPGTVHTPSWEERVSAAPNPEKAKKDFIARQPMGRLGTAEEIATLAIYLASDESDFVTGITHAIDGGMSI